MRTIYLIISLFACDIGQFELYEHNEICCEISHDGCDQAVVHREEIARAHTIHLLHKKEKGFILGHKALSK